MVVGFTTDVGAGRINLTSQVRENWFLVDGETELRFFPPTRSMEQVVGAGTAIYARLTRSLDTDAAGHWFVLESGDLDRDLSDAEFPVDPSTAPRLGS